MKIICSGKTKKDLLYTRVCWAGKPLCRGTTEAKLSQLSQDWDCWSPGAYTEQRSHLVTLRVLCHSQQYFGLFAALIQVSAPHAYIYINPVINDRKTNHDSNTFKVKMT